MNTKLVWMYIRPLNEPFILMFFCLKTSKHPLNTTSANDTVIPGQDQGSNLYDSTMPARALNNNKKTQEQKNKRIQIMPIRLFVQKQASAHTSECPSWQKNCSAKHSILKRNKRKDLLFFITKGSRRHRPQVRKHWLRNVPQIHLQELSRINGILLFLCSSV